MINILITKTWGFQLKVEDHVRCCHTWIVLKISTCGLREESVADGETKQQTKKAKKEGRTNKNRENERNVIHWNCRSFLKISTIVHHYSLTPSFIIFLSSCSDLLGAELNGFFFPFFSFLHFRFNLTEYFYESMSRKIKILILSIIHGD